MLRFKPGHKASFTIAAAQADGEVTVTFERTGDWVPLDQPGEPEPPQYAPADLEGEPATTAILWNWGAVADATGYAIEYGPEGGPYAITDAGATPGFFHGDLEPETTYEARVFAYNAAGDGPESAFVRVTTLAEPEGPSPTPPQEAPANLQGVPSATAIAWTWEAVAGATDYTIEHGPAGGPRTSTDVGGQLEFTQTGLDSDRLYEARASARNTAGSGPQTDFVQVMTLEEPVAPPLPNDPLDLPNLILGIDPARSPRHVAGGGVAHIDDLSPGGHRYAQPDNGRRPALDPDGVQGGPALVGDGDRVLWTDGAVVWGGVNAPRAIYCIVRGSPQVDRQVYAEASTVANSPIFEFGTGPSQTGRLRLYVRDDGGTVRTNVTTTRNVFDGQPHIVCVTWNAQGQGQIWVDGHSDVTFALAGLSSVNRSALLGIMRGSPGFMFDGRLGPLYVYAEARTPEQAEVVEGYLQDYGTGFEQPPAPPPPPGGMVLTRHNNRFLLGGVPITPFGIRGANALETQAITEDFIAHFDTILEHGIQSFSMFVQGGRHTKGGNSNFNGYNSDGTLKQPIKDRLAQILDASRAKGLVPVVGCFYRGRDQELANADAVRRAVRDTVEFIKPWRHAWMNVINEPYHGGFSHALTSTANGYRELYQVAKAADPERIVYVSHDSGANDGFRCDTWNRVSGLNPPSNGNVSIEYIGITGSGGAGADDFDNPGTFGSDFRATAQSRIEATVAAGGYFFTHSAWQQKTDAPGWPRWDRGGIGSSSDRGVGFFWDKFKELAGPVQPPPGGGGGGGESPDAVQVELYRWHDFAVEAPGVGGNKFDVEGEIVWTHQPSGERRTSRVWYQGSGDTFVYRFGAPFQGLWTGTTASPVAALDGIELAVNVTPSSNPNRTGWSGQIAGQPQAWARQKGPDGALVKRTPQLAMFGQPRYWWDNLEQMRARVRDLLDDHGFTGVHMPVIGSQWFDVTRYASLPSGDANPDPRTFAALEALCTECSDRGAWLKFWMWGKTNAGEWQRLQGGYSGGVGRRIHRYIAARLGPVPGWWAGVGYDVEFWINKNNPDQFRWWLDELSSRFGGYHHWLSGRYSDSDVGAGIDPEPANKGEYRARGVTWNTLRPGAAQAADWEHWAPLVLNPPHHPKLNEMLTVTPDRPCASGDRFRTRTNGWAQKDLPDASAILEWLPPFQSRGTAAIWGHISGANDEGSGPWPNRAAIKSMMTDLDDDGGGGGSGNGAHDAPALGVFTHGEVIRTQEFTDLVGMPVTLWETFLPRETWTDVESPGWKINPLAQSIRENPDVLVVYGQPPFARSEGWGREGLLKGAAGQFNGRYATIAQRWRNVGIDRMIVRFGWEWNGGWYAWGVQMNTDNARLFAQMWRHFVEVVRTEYPDGRFLFDWNPTQDVYPALLEAAWPGADVVDIIGVDCYDENWWSVYRGECDRFNYNCRWRDTAERLGWISALARAHNKPLSFPEWGVWGDGGSANDTRGGGDNDFYIRKMWEFMLDPANRVAYSVYFNVRAAGDHRLETHRKALAAFKAYGRAAPTPPLDLTQQSFASGRYVGAIGPTAKRVDAA